MKAFLNARKIEVEFSVYQVTIRDYDLVFECMEYCTDKYQECSELCVNDLDCKSQCDVELSGCLNICPCQAGCPSGCEGKTVIPEELKRP